MREFDIIDAEQRSAAWFAARLGRVTGSVAGDLLANGRGGHESTKRRDLRTRLVLERLTGQSADDDYINGDMRRGIELEPEALLAYEAETGACVQRTGFLAHRTLPIGCSLDGHLGDFETLIEVKCPRPAIHWGYIKAGVLPSEYRPQIVHNMLVSGATAAEFVSYHRAFPEYARLFRVRVERDDKDIESYRLALMLFLKEVDEEFAEVSRRGLVAVA